MPRFSFAPLLLVVVAACSAMPSGTTSDGASAETKSNGTRPGPKKTAGGAPIPADGSNPAQAAAANTAAAGTSCGVESTTPVDTTDLDPFFAEKMAATGAPGMAVVVVGGGKIKWKKGYGLANVEEQRPVTPDTLFMLASISKTVTAVSLMSLLEDGSRGITLDSDVNEKLPFSVRNPQFEDTAITYRMLLTHSSSLIDSDAYNSNPELPGDSAIPLLQFERDYVAQDDSWSEDAPGTAYSYSNTGASLAGLLAEQISGKDLQTYAKAAIFDKLGMPESSYFLKGLDQSHIAMPYSHGEPQGFFGYPDYPDGQLRTSATQLAHFLLMLIGKGECGGQRVLAAETIAEMEKPQIPDVDPTQGLILFTEDVGGTTVMGHDGADMGVSTDMFFDPSTGNGYIVLTNGSANYDGSDDERAALTAINEKLLELARTLP
jgi:CubicO group peptidase (beta-lactamase class C family)